MKDTNGLQIYRDQKISAKGDFDGIAVNQNGIIIEPRQDTRTTFDGSEELIVWSTLDGENCRFIHEGYAYEVWPNERDKKLITIQP